MGKLVMKTHRWIGGGVRMERFVRESARVREYVQRGGDKREERGREKT